MELAAAVALRRRPVPRWEIDDNLDELEALAASAGVSVVERLVQDRPAPSASTFIGRGKAEEIRRIAEKASLDLILFDDEISPVQAGNLERIIGRKVIDRTELILDIFASKAGTHEAKVQVEIAQLRYRLSRLSGRGIVLSRLGGGVGTRGPGETVLETDRRRIRDRITALKRKLTRISRRREAERRRRSGFPVGAVVGYTNAGKTSLVNRMSGARLFADDRLFATLDATVRRVRLGGGSFVLLADTVGFIRKFPAHLAASFRSTLGEVSSSDFIVHVIDASSKRREDEIAAVETELDALGAAEKPRITVLSKIDLLPRGLGVWGDAVPFSSKTGEGSDLLAERLARTMRISGRESDEPNAQGRSAVVVT